MLEAISAQALVPLLVAVAIAGVAFVLAYPYISGDAQTQKRIQTVTESRAKKVAVRSAAEVAASRRKVVADSLKEIESRQKAKEKVTLRLRLQRAGLAMSPKAFWIWSAATGTVAALATYVGLYNSVLAVPLTLAAAFVGMMGLPRWVLAMLIKRRQSKFLAELANAIDIVVRGVKSGLPLNECLQIIARESPEPIGGEFRDVVEQQRVGVSLADALERMIQRMPLPEVKFLAIVIAIQQQAGGNLSEALGNLSGVLRDRIKLQMKVKALSAEAKASATVLGSLPPMVVLMVYLSSPEYIVPLFKTKTGNIMLGAGLLWMGMGILVMKKMINFKY